MIHAVEFGTGNLIAIGLHGWGGDHRTFSPLAPMYRSSGVYLRLIYPVMGKAL